VRLDVRLAVKRRMRMMKRRSEEMNKRENEAGWKENLENIYMCRLKRRA